MAFKILAGQHGNLVGRGVGYGATPSEVVEVHAGGEEADYPVENLYDGRPSVPFRFSSAIVQYYAIKWPNNLIVNGDMEQDTSVGWIASSGATVVDENSLVHRGSQALELQTTTSGDYCYQDVTVHPGEWLKFSFALRGDGASSISPRLQNLNTGRWLDNTGAWQVGVENLFPYTTAAWAETSETFQVEDFNDDSKDGNYFGVEQPTVTLRVYLVGFANTSTYHADECLLIPGINHISVHGHGFARHCGMGLAGAGADYWHSPSHTLLTGTTWDDYDDDDFMTGQTVHLAGTMTYEVYPSVWWYPYGDGSTANDNGIAPWIGELVVGQTADLSRNPDYPVTVDYIEPNVRYGTSSGGQWVMNRSGHPRRRVTMSFAYHTDAEYREARERLLGLSRGGAYPVVLVPTETDPDSCVFGRVGDSATFSRIGIVARTAEFVVDEEPLPWVT